MISQITPVFQPPGGTNFHLEDDVPAVMLAAALCRVAVFAQDVEPYNAKLRLFHDWWEHDGLHFSRGWITLHELFAMVGSPRSLLEAMPGEESVFIGVASERIEWYLRFYLHWTDEGDALVGRFDITVSDQRADQLRQRLAPLGLPLVEQEAASYYATIRT